MKKAFLFLPILTLLFACNSQQSRGDDDSYKPGRPIGDDNYYALFMYNYPRVVDESAYGMPEKHPYCVPTERSDLFQPEALHFL